tara:strand:+ start:291 stop:806 length:516 start_codon:yes stop_codon:yes gene_type:complete
MKIYKIIDNTNGNVYIGKTKQTLNQRLIGHRFDYKKNNPCSSKEVIANGDYKIELIEETDDDTRERYWIENTQCVNKNIPGRTDKERYQDQREYRLDKQKKYQENNKEKRKEWLEKNKDKIKDDKQKYDLKYREDNKLKIRNYQSMLRKYRKSWGEYNMSLLKIDPNLFLI